ncbi:MAG: LPXTG cell wall anchor domain-containing protein [Ruminococcus sp.]|nr:LPXTG cell wall anchor domain-containing protein [Ruminococcus sp.]
MGIPYNKYIQFLRSSKKKRRQLACFVTALSVFVSGGVFWQLRGIGTAMVDENLPNADDSGEAITVTPLNASELETQDVWEATLPPLTDIAGENLARIAESQLGYSESSVNFVHAEDGETHNGYTRYGAWYGNPYGEWNTMFTYFCLNYAGVSSDDIPYGSGCWAWSLELDKAGLIVPVTRGSPARGDILLIDSDLDGKAERSCIVQSVSDDEISAVEGDIDGSVALTSYLIGDEQLLGMVSLADIVPEPTVLPEEPAEVDFSAESESGICVEAHADRDAFPPDTEMFVFDISQDEAVQAAADHFGDEAPDDIQAVAVDITFMTPDGEELEPAEDSQVRVSIVLPEEQSLTGGEFSLLHVSDEGDVQEVADADVSADGADFVAEEFSVYVLTSNSTPTISDLNVVNLSQITAGVPGSSQDNPLIITVGQHITVYSDEPASGSGFTIYPNDRNEDGINTLVRDSNHQGNASLNNGMVAYYVGNSSDSTIIQFDETPKVYVNVIKPSIYVVTNVGEIDKDYVHAYLVDANGDSPDILNQCIYDADNKPIYIKNSSTDAGKYVVYQGDTIKLVSYIADNQLPNSNGKYFSFDGSVTNINESVVSLGNGLKKISAEVSVNNSGNGSVSVAGQNFYIWSRASNSSNTFNHSDIEIADGGQYIVEDIIEYPDGRTVKTITRYIAYVSGVNECIIYGKDGSPLNIHDTATNIDYSSYTTQDYWFDPVFKPGDSQYEYTSAYNKSSGNTVYSTKVFWAKDAYTATFDISLNLEPDTEQVIITQNGEIISNMTEDISDRDTLDIPSVLFNLNHRSVIDAFNKCPNHGGLDFTLQADINSLVKSIAVPVEAKKALTNAQDNLPNNEQFEFELLSDSHEVISTATNDAYGNIIFPHLIFMKEGTYNYTIREKQNAADTAVIYDTNTHQVVITVSKGSDGKLTATIKYDGNTTIPTFNNTLKTYTLPATGGTGELPYILFGSAMLAGAFTLLFIRRKKAAAR